MSIEATRLVDWYDEDGFKEGTKAPHKWVLQAAEELRRLRDENAALRQAIERAEKQEPVAWMENSIEFYAKDHPTNSCTIPLYPAPPRKEWVGLTDEEIAEGARQSWVDKQAFESAVWWAEEKLKEKNGG